MSRCLLAAGSARGGAAQRPSHQTGSQLREQASAVTTELGNRWDPEPNRGTGDRAGGSPQPRADHAQDRVLRF